VLNVGVAWWIDVFFDDEFWSFWISLHDNFLHKTNIPVSFFLVEAEKERINDNTNFL
jgi:hypothetical protein